MLGERERQDNQVGIGVGANDSFAAFPRMGTATASREETSRGGDSVNILFQYQTAKVISEEYDKNANQAGIGRMSI